MPQEKKPPLRRAAPTIADIARATGVSVATVSNALSGHGRVSARKSKEIAAAATEMAYVPQHAARALRNGKTLIVGLVVPNITNPIFTAMAQAIDECLHARGYGVLLADSKNRRRGQNEAMLNLAARGADALIVIPRHDSNMVETGIPCVVIDAPDEASNAIGSDHRNGGRLIARHLVRLGHKNIAILAGPDNSTVARARLGGMREVFDAKTCLHYRIQHSAYGPDAADEVLSDLTISSFTAIAAVSDTLAVGALRYLKRRGVKVPEDISVSGFDGTIWTEICTPAITTVRQDVHEIARRATARAVGEASADFTVPVSLIVRGSTGPARHSTVQPNQGEGK